MAYAERAILKQYKLAGSDYVRLLVVNPKFFPAFNNLAYLYSERLDRLDAAYEPAKRARIILPHVEQCLVPTLKRNDIVVTDNLRAHKVLGVEEAIEKARAKVRYLPKYSPDLNPIEMPYSKFKALLREAALLYEDATEPFALSFHNLVLTNVPITSGMLQNDRNLFSRLAGC